MVFKYVALGLLVWSSYKAAEFFLKNYCARTQAARNVTAQPNFGTSSNKSLSNLTNLTRKCVASFNSSSFSHLCYYCCCCCCCCCTKNILNGFLLLLAKFIWKVHFKGQYKLPNPCWDFWLVHHIRETPIAKTTTQDTVLYQDKKSSIVLEKNRKMSSSKHTKRMNIQYFYVKDRVDSKDIRIEYCLTEDILADYFTKPLQGSI